jgi:two-component system, LytTR family, response regulator
MLRVAIVDDEANARAAIRILLARRHDVDIVAECRNGIEAVEVLQWLTVDLLLLDVQMPGLDGFGVLHAVGPDRVPPTVFVTAFGTR